MKRKIIENYTLCEILGEGSFGKVYQGINNLTNDLYAIKVIPIQKFQQNSRLEQCSANQIKNLTRIQPNPYIIKFVQMLKTPNNFYFVYQFCNGKTLDARLKQQTKLPQKQALRIFSQLLEAFKILNKYNIMHRDLKPDNIFFHNGNLKLGDFGFCKTLLRQGDMTSTMLGSPIYMAPEVLRGQIYTSKADIWSLGVVLYEMLFGVCPFESNSIAKLISVLDNTQLNFPFQISLATKTLLKRLLTKDQFKRIDWFQLLTMNLNGYQKDSLSNSTLSITSSASSIAQLEKRINQFRVPDLTSSARVPSVFSLNSQANTDLVFKKKSDSASKLNPENNKIQKATSLKSNQSFSSNNKIIKQIINPPPQSSPAILRKASLPLKGEIKRKQLLYDHNSCLQAVKTAVNFYKSQDCDSLLFCYILFKRVQYITKRLIVSISINQPQLEDIQSSATQQIKFIQNQIEQLEIQLKKQSVDIDTLISSKTALKDKYNQNSNPKLWYEMIIFLTEAKMNSRASQIEWNQTINNYLA